MFCYKYTTGLITFKKIILDIISIKPGPASSEEDLPPNNPAIQVQFLTEADGYFFTEWQTLHDTYLLETFSPEKSEGTIYWKENRLYILPLNAKRNVA